MKKKKVGGSSAGSVFVFLVALLVLFAYSILGGLILIGVAVMIDTMGVKHVWKCQRCSSITERSPETPWFFYTCALAVVGFFVYAIYSL